MSIRLCWSAALHGGELDLGHVVDEVHLVGELVERPEPVEVLVGEVPADDGAEVFLELLVGEGRLLRQDLADGASLRDASDRKVWKAPWMRL